MSVTGEVQQRIHHGLSARSKLAGYPIRFDIAWPGRFNKKPLFYFSLNIDS